MTASARFPWERDGEFLVLETPEQTTVEYRVAPFGARILAAMLDRVLILAVSLLLAVPIMAMLSNEIGEWVAGIGIAVWFLCSNLYFVWAELRWNGMTIGKRRLRLRAVLATGQGITFGASLIRNLARLVDEWPLFWLVPALTPGGRRIGDLLAGTYVITETVDRVATRRTRWIDGLAPSYAALEERRFAFTADRAGRLRRDDLNLLEYLDGRIGGMSRSRRRQTLDEIAGRYAARLDFADQQAQIVEDPERFLQELALFLRARFEERIF